MPSKTKKQARFMAAVAHGWKPDNVKAPPLKVAKEFNKADAGRRNFGFGGLAQMSMMDPQRLAMMAPTPPQVALATPTPAQIGSRPYLGPAKSVAKPPLPPGMMFPRPTPSRSPGNTSGALSTFARAPGARLQAFSSARPIGTPGTSPNALIATAGDVNALAGNRLNRLNQGLPGTGNARPLMRAKGGRIGKGLTIEHLMEKIRPYYDTVDSMTQDDVNLLNRHFQDYEEDSGRSNKEVTEEIQRIIKEERPNLNRERPMEFAKGGRIITREDATSKLTKPERIRTYLQEAYDSFSGESDEPDWATLHQALQIIPGAKDLRVKAKALEQHFADPKHTDETFEQEVNPQIESFLQDLNDLSTTHGFTYED